MQITNFSYRHWALLALVFLMSATRFHHFGSVTFLPDASLAVFFLAGYYLFSASAQTGQTSGWLPAYTAAIFTVLLLLAGLLDYLAISYGGVSDFCISPAYLFLIPTYALMMAAGKFCSRYLLLSVSGALKTAGILVAATTLAFLISNGSFYWSSDTAGALNWSVFAETFRNYYLSYVTYTLLYSAIILSVQSCLSKAFSLALTDQLRLR